MSHGSIDDILARIARLEQGTGGSRRGITRFGAGTTTTHRLSPRGFRRSSRMSR